MPTLNAEANLFAPSKRNFITPFDVSTVCPEADVSAESLALSDFSDGSKWYFKGGESGGMVSVCRIAGSSPLSDNASPLSDNFGKPALCLQQAY